MSIITDHLKFREVISQVVKDPDYKAISQVPVWSWHQIGLTVLAYTLCLGGAFLILRGVSVWLIYPVMIFGFYTAFTPLHDATHKSVSSNGFINDLLGTINGNLLFPFVTTSMYRYFHLSHHRYVGDEDLDPDEPMVSIPTKYFPLGYLVLFFYEYFIFRWLFTKVWKRTPDRTKGIILFSLLGNLALYVLMLSSSYWYEFLICFVIPNRLAIAYTNFTFAHLPHPEGVHVHEHPFQATYTLIGNKLALDSLWGQADHSMHHFLPHVPWYNYKSVWALANGVLYKQGIPERKIYSSPQFGFRERLQESTKDCRKTIRVQIASVEDVAEGVKSFSFVSPSGEVLPGFTAGAHVTLDLPSGKKRSYSLVNAPHERDRYQIAVKCDRAGKGGSVEIHDDLKEGDILNISAPVNHFVLYENVEKYILISGGIGITPLISMAHRLSLLEKKFEFHICAKSEDQIPFQYELKNWSFAPNVDIHLDRDGRSSLDVMRILSKPSDDTLIYICGPRGFMEWVKSTAIGQGWPSDHIMIENFSAAAIDSRTAKAFELKLQKSGKSIQVGADQTIIDALLMNGVQVDYSCLQGTCGTCVCNVVDGEVDHRDGVLTEEDKTHGRKICLCVSRAKKERIILDI